MKLWLEFIFFFLVLPLIVYLFKTQLAPFAVPIIVIVAIYSSVILYKAGVLDKQWQKMRNHTILDYIPTCLFFGCASLLILTMNVILNFSPHSSGTQMSISYFMLLVLFYPIVSVIPQEIVFRTFFFHRYRSLFGSITRCAIASGMCFGYAHLIYGNWVAVILASVGGILFSYRYMKTKATNIVVLEHSLWGIFVFTIGFSDQFVAWNL